MATPKAHIGATAVLLVVVHIIGFFIRLSLGLLNVVWIVSFGVLIDVDHFPFGRLWAAFKTSGIRGVWESWKKYGWFDAEHVNVLHTWWALVAIIIFSIVTWNAWPFVAYTIHMLIDGGSRHHSEYPVCSPMPRDINRFYPRRLTYHYDSVPGVPSLPAKN